MVVGGGGGGVGIQYGNPKFRVTKPEPVNMNPKQ